ncbi:MAG: SdrD B-like domain-containing protein [Methanothrix sp.]
MDESAAIWRMVPLAINESVASLKTTPQVASSYISAEKSSINGIVFKDINADGLKTEGEPGLPNWTIVLKYDGKDLLQVTTNKEGLYSLADLSPGIYTVEEKLLDGWNQTLPAQGSYIINFVGGIGYNYDFGNSQGSFPVPPGIVTHPLLSRSEWIRMTDELETAPTSTISYGQRAAVSYPSSLSLLGYVPSYSQRNQGSCGNCWAWAGTGLTEIARYAQLGIKERLSIQYLNSNFDAYGRWACCSGSVGDYVRFYNSKGKFVPWNNLNAQYQDGTNHCCHDCSGNTCSSTSCCSQTGCGGVGHSSVSAGSIIEYPNYPVTTIPNYYYILHGIAQDQAIDAIKGALNQNKALVFTFYLPSSSAWTSFNNMWSSGGVWDPAAYCNQPISAGSGGHLALCVGYDDASDTWIMLNSWGAGGRGDGTFRVKMHMDYDCSNGGSYSYWFQGFDVTFKTSNSVALQAANGQYVCAEGSGGGAVVANRNAVGAWETFRVIDLGNGNVALLAANGQYVCAVGGGGNGVAANSNSLGAWETFKLIDRGNGYYALQASNGQYVCAENGGGSTVVANRNAIGAWEMFRFFDFSRPAPVALQAANGQYVCAVGGGGNGVAAGSNSVGAMETFNLINGGNGNVALQAANGQYVCAEGSGGGAVVANRNAVGAWETFKLIYRGNGNVALQAANGQYVCAEGGGGDGVVANRDAIGAWETFKLIPT